MKHTRRNSHVKAKMHLIGLILGGFGLAGTTCAQNAKPEIIDYYWNHAAQYWQSNQKAISNRLESCDVTAIVKELSRGGVVKSADTSVSRYFYSPTAVDSVVHLSGEKRLSVDVDLATPAIFDSVYHKFFFPNDTGAGDLAIGFDTDTLIDRRPTGILTIDRESYCARRLHISWPHKPGFRRFGRSYHFVQMDQLTVVDTIIESAVIERLLADDDYRLEITITNYRLRQPVDSLSR